MNSTQYFNFPLFEATDKPSWLTDWNGLVEELDNLLEENKELVLSHSGLIDGLTTNINRVDAAIASLTTLVDTLEDHETELGGRVTIVENTLISIDTEVKSLATRVAELETNSATKTELQALETTVNSFTTRIDNLSAKLEDTLLSLWSLARSCYTEWKPNTYYITGDKVLYRRFSPALTYRYPVVYQCTAPHTSTDTFDSSKFREITIYDPDSVTTLQDLVKLNAKNIKDKPKDIFPHTLTLAGQDQSISPLYLRQKSIDVMTLDSNHKKFVTVQYQGSTMFRGLMVAIPRELVIDAEPEGYKTRYFVEGVRCHYSTAQPEQSAGLYGFVAGDTTVDWGSGGSDVVFTSCDWKFDYFTSRLFELTDSTSPLVYHRQVNMPINMLVRPCYYVEDFDPSDHLFVFILPVEYQNDIDHYYVDFCFTLEQVMDL